MDPAGIPALIDAIHRMHNCKATWLETAFVRETFGRETVWEGFVQIFAVRHPQTSLIYCWSEAVGKRVVEGCSARHKRRRFYAVLATGGVDDAAAAVRLSVVSDVQDGRI